MRLCLSKPSLWNYVYCLLQIILEAEVFSASSWAYIGSIGTAALPVQVVYVVSLNPFLSKKYKQNKLINTEIISYKQLKHLYYFVLSCSVLLRLVLSCSILLPLVSSCSVLLRLVLSCQGLSCFVLFRLASSCSVLLRLVLSCFILLPLVLSCSVLLRLILSCSVCLIPSRSNVNNVHSYTSSTSRSISPIVAS